LGHWDLFVIWFLVLGIFNVSIKQVNIWKSVTNLFRWRSSVQEAIFLDSQQSFAYSHMFSIEPGIKEHGFDSFPAWFIFLSLE